MYLPDSLAKLDLFLISEIVSVLSLLVSLSASAHVVLTKRDTRAAIGWIGLIWLSPFVGTAIYVVLGINRISRKARLLRKSKAHIELPHPAEVCAVHQFREALGGSGSHLDALEQLMGRLSQKPLLSGNEIHPLLGGDQAYPAMLKAIDEATRSVGLSSYIFNDDRAGKQFVVALERARNRGVEVRVLIDGVGKRYGWPPITRSLKRAGIRSATFLPALTPGWLPYMNLRNHRKILVTDGRVGFTGGMNIVEEYLTAFNPKSPKHDAHFEVHGPAVATLQQVFADDWLFSTEEELGGEAWFPPLEPAGTIVARGLADGPDEDFGKLYLAFLGALASARSSITIISPYFLPDATLISALNVASLRGVKVDVILPFQNNLKLVKWASTPLLEFLLEQGCRIWYSPPPFDHTKLMLVDRQWAFIGSANWDPRSYRLNFEFNLECYGPSLVETLVNWVEERLVHAHRVTIEEIQGRSLPIKLRDGVARLFTPYL